MCGGGPLPGNPTTSTNASVPPVSLPVALNVTNSLFAIQTDLPLPDGTCVVLTMRTPSYPTPYSMIPLSEGPFEHTLAAGLRERFSHFFLHPAQVAGTGCACLPESGSPRSFSTPLRSTAFMATMIEESDIRSADHSGRNMMA